MFDVARMGSDGVVRWNALECAGVGHSLDTNFRTYWITWSARPTSDCGSVSPKASAIFFNRLREPPGITGTQKRIKGLSGGSPNSIRPADPYCRGAPRYSGSPHGCPGAPREQTAPVVRRSPGRGEDDVDRRGRASRRIGRRQQEIGALGQEDLPVARGEVRHQDRRWPGAARWAGGQELPGEGHRR